MPVFTLASGLRIAFEHYGDRQGTPAFYFHGWPSSGLQGGLMDEVGRKYGLHFVAMDRPGIGGSDYQEGRQLLDWPQVLRQLADHLGWSQFHVFGVSGGGPYALVSTYHLQERVLSTTVICGAPPLKLLGTRDLFWPYKVALVLRRLIPWALGPVFRIGAWFTKFPPNKPPVSWVLQWFNEADRQALQDPVTGDIVSAGFRVAARSGLQALQTDGDIYTSDWGFDLSDIQGVVHFWHGKADRNIPWTYAAKVAAMIPRSVTHWTENDGHYSMAISRVDEITRTALGRVS